MINQSLLTVSGGGSLFVIIFSLIFAASGFVVYAYVNNQKLLRFIPFFKIKIKTSKKSRLGLIILLTFLAALVLRIILAVIYDGHQDITYFRFWLDELVKNSPYNYYDNIEENSYLPGYLYLLYALGGILKLFNIEPYYALLKLPAIFCDLATSYLIFLIAKKYLNKKMAFAVCFLYLFNPAVILNSSLWGQVDSFTAFFTVLSLYYLTQNKFIQSFIFVAFGMAFKLQFAFVLPVIIGYTIYMLIGYIKEKQYKKMQSVLYAVIIMVATFILLVLPFTLKYMLQGDLLFVFKVYFNQTDSFNFFALNTFNFYSMILKNWGEIPTDKIAGFLTYDTLNYIVIALISIYCIVLTVLNKTKSGLYLISALLILAIFTFSMKMHERYSFVALSLLLISAIISKDKSIYTAFIAFTLLQFLNTGVLLFSSPRYFLTDDMFLFVFSNISVFYFIYFAYIATSKILSKNKQESTEKSNNLTEENEENEIEYRKDLKTHIESFDEKYNQSLKTRKQCKLVRKDFIIMAVFFIVYFLINMINLGGTITPETWWEVKDNDEYIILEIPEGVTIGEIWAYKGIDIVDSTSNNIKVYAGNALDSEDYDSFITAENYKCKKGITNNGTNDTGSMYKWFEVGEIDSNYKYIAFTASRYVRINEIVLLESESRDTINYNVLYAKTTTTTTTGENSVLNAFDEKETYLGYNSLMTDMYFDEIYHARTAFEHINGWEPYEVTHPPLGKIIISIGIRIFGMNPFGWRISGVFFSALLLSVMYALGRQLFKKTKWAVLFALLSALDGLHFVQGRIATIDTYPVFFSALSMLFMIKFYRTNILREKTIKCLIPFALSGLFFGLAVASKWTGVYTGGGLLVILLIYVYKILDEYRYNAAYYYNNNDDGYKKYSKSFDYKLVYIILTGLAFYIVLPFIVYLLSYLPYMTEQKSLQNLFNIMIDNQMYMYNYHSKWVVGITHQCQSPWYSWFFNYKSVYMYCADNSFNMYARIHSMGNHIINWFGIVALCFCIYSVFKKQFIFVGNKVKTAKKEELIEKLNKKGKPLPLNIEEKFKQKTFTALSPEKKEVLMFLFIGLLSAILPWVLVERSTFIYHFYPSMPYYIGMIIFTLIYICEKHNKVIFNIKIGLLNQSVTKGGLFTGIYIALAVIFFILLFPVVTGIPVAYNVASVMFLWLGYFGGHVGF